MQYSVTVTKADIENGKPRDGSACAVALALQRATGRKDIAIGTFSIEAGGVRIGRAPDRMSRFIGRFDAGFRPVRSVRFRVNLDLLPTAPKAGSK